MIRLRAPAKLNLYLRVLGKRPEGYRECEQLNGIANVELRMSNWFVFVIRHSSFDILP